MGRAKKVEPVSPTTRKKRPPALTPEARENQMIALAMDLAERQLQEGTASAQVISHFLRLGTMKEKLEQEDLRERIKLNSAKTESYESSKRIEELYTNAINAMKTYSGTIQAAEGVDDDIDD